MKSVAWFIPCMTGTPENFCEQFQSTEPGIFPGIIENDFPPKKQWSYVGNITDFLKKSILKTQKWEADKQMVLPFINHFMHQLSVIKLYYIVKTTVPTKLMLKK